MVLVTGASGFLGRHLVRYLSAQGLQVRALYHNHPPTDELKALAGITWQQCDLLDIYDVETAMHGIADIYHCAAIVSYDPDRREEMLHYNPEITAHIVNQALEQDIRKMVYISSIAAIGRSGENKKEITEETEWGESNYSSAYGLSKYLAEMEVWRGIGEGLNAVIVNPGIILGPGHSEDLAVRLMDIVYKNFPFYPAGTTSWVGVDDVVKAITMLMSSDIDAERFILSEGNFSYREIFTVMADALQKIPPRYRATPLLSGLVWRLHKIKSVITGTRPLITKESAANASTSSLYNNSKLLQAFPGFAYTPISETITDMARSFVTISKA